MKLFRTRWRVVFDRYAGFEVQHKRFWWPFWVQTDGCNTFMSLESAKKFITSKKKPIWEE